MEPTDDGTGWAGTRARVDRLRAADRDLRGFGAASHGLTLAPALSQEQVGDAERRLGIRFPEAYRSFLVEVGAGGAGPGYGLTTLRAGDDGWSWDGDGSADALLDRLDVPALAVDELQALQAAVPEVGPQREDFPTVAAWEAASAAWVRADEETVVITHHGSVPLGHQGCGWYHWLVVSGPHRGEVREIGVETYHLAPDFRTYYLRWLAGAEKEAGC